MVTSLYAKEGESSGKLMVSADIDQEDDANSQSSHRRRKSEKAGSKSHHIYHGEIKWPKKERGDTKTTFTVPTEKMMFVSALEAYIDITQEDVDPEQHHVRARAARLRTNIVTMHDDEWILEYDQIMAEFVVIMAMSSDNDVLEMAQAGLDALTSELKVSVPPVKEFNFSKKITALDSVMKDNCTSILRPLDTSMVMPVRTKKEPIPPPQRLPPLFSHYKDSEENNLRMQGDHAKSQLYAWSAYGCLESSAASSASRIFDIEESVDIVKDKAFVLLGAASSMSPFESLLEMGATMICVDLPTADFSHMMQMVATEGPNGTVMYVPVMHDDDGTFLYGELRHGRGKPGADLIRHAPELAQWIAELLPKRQLVLCNLATTEGEENLRLAAATDLITKYVCEKRPDTALSYIISPNVVHAITDEMANDAKRRKRRNPKWLNMFSNVSSQLVPSNTWNDHLEGTNFRVLNSLCTAQGSHFALAQIINMWRAMVMYDEGHVVSANVGPPTRYALESIESDMFSVDVDGVQHIDPIVSFDSITARSLMAALMLHDVSLSDCVANPKSNKKVKHPLEIFIDNAVHGGIWRCPYLWDTLGVPSKILRSVVWTDLGWCPKEALAPLAPPSK